MKFTIQIQDLSQQEALDVVGRLGNLVLRGTIHTENNIIDAGKADAAPAPAMVTQLTPAQKAAQTRALKKAQDEKAATTSVGPVPPLNAGGHPFPGGAPANFAPGNPPAPAPAQPVYHAPAAAPQPAPVHAPMAPAPQAPVMQVPPAPVEAPVSAERKQWNDACIQLIGEMKKTGLPQDQLTQVMANAFLAAGLPAQSKITTISDSDIQRFYPVLYQHVAALFQPAQQ